jgi:hypothetical protein
MVPYAHMARRTRFTAAVTLGTLLSCLTLYAQQPLQVADGSQLAQIIAKAKANGQTTLTTPFAVGIKRAPVHLDIALKETRVVLARVEASTVTVDTSEPELTTWDKLSILETLSNHEHRNSGFYRQKVQVPAALGPVSRDMIAVAYAGGTALIRSVTVTTPANFHHLEVGKTYLLFLTLANDLSYVKAASERDAYLLLSGSDAIYRVDGDALVPESVGDVSAKLIARDLKSKCGDNLRSFRSYLLSH